MTLFSFISITPELTDKCSSLGFTTEKLSGKVSEFSKSPEILTTPEIKVETMGAPIVSTLISGVVKISGDFENSETLPDSFSVVNPKELHLSVSSGVIEMKENKVIILTD